MTAGDCVIVMVLCQIAVAQKGRNERSKNLLTILGFFFSMLGLVKTLAAAL